MGAKHRVHPRTTETHGTSVAWCGRTSIDLIFALREQVRYEDVIAFLCRQDIIDKYGFIVNPVKCWFASQNHMKMRGKKALGSWVGDPDDESSDGSTLTHAAADIIEERLQRLEERSSRNLQQKLVIVRLCYYPALNHLLRTLHPAVGVDGVRRFDKAIFEHVTRWIGDRSLLAPANIQQTKDIFNLQLRLGGLGFVSQELIKTAAAGAQIIASQTALRDRSLCCSRRVLLRYQTAIQLCASNLNMTVDAVVTDEHALKPQLQRKATQVIHERHWFM